MPKCSNRRTKASSMQFQVELELAPLTEEEDNERIKRLTRKILRVVENFGRRKKERGDDLSFGTTLEKEIAI